MADGGERVGDSDPGLGIPGGASGQNEAMRGAAAGPECDERKQGEQARRGAGDGQVRLLALGFDVQASVHLGERDPNGPAPDDEAQRVEGVGSLVYAQAYGSNAPASSCTSSQRTATCLPR